MKNRKRNRLKGYDYSRNNLYFVTICVHKMVCCFGEVVVDGIDGIDAGTSRDLSVRELSMRELSVRELSVRESEQNKSEKRMKLNELGQIVKDRLIWLENQYKYVALHANIVMPNHVHAILEIDSNLIEDKNIKIKSLSSLIGAFKTTSSKKIHQSGFKDFKWHRSFHDHIIRDDRAYQNISNYIDTNPNKWKMDVFYA